MILPSTGASASVSVVQGRDVLLRDQHEMHRRRPDGCRGTPARRRPRTPSARDLAAHDLAEDAVRVRRPCAHGIAAGFAAAAGALQRPRAAFSAMTRNALAARQLGQHVRRDEPVPREQHEAVKPQVGDFGDDARSLSPSFAAMTVSVASSPIFFRIASSPLREQRRDVGARRVGAACATRSSRRAARARRRRRRISHRRRSSFGSLSTGSTSCHSPSSSRWKKQRSRPVWQAMPPTCSTTSSDRVAVAVEADLAHALHVAGRSPLRHSLPRERDQ